MSAYPQAALTPTVTNAERWLAAAAHAGLVLGVPFLGPIVTLALATWVRPSDFVKRQSLQALVFHAAVGVVFVIGLVIAGSSGIFAFIQEAMRASAEAATVEIPSGLGTALAILVADFLFLAWTSILGLVATVRTFQGRDYRYPLIGNLF